jgi:quercetin dioxygenase-like cupin family protein
MTVRKSDATLPHAVVESLVNAMQPAELNVAQRERMRTRVLSQAREAAPEGTETLRNESAEWIEITPAVEIRELSRDARGGTHVSLVRMRPGGVIKAHRHKKDEDFIVLEGECQIGTHVLSVGDVHRAAAGSRHEQVTTRSGVLVLLCGEYPYPT